MPTSEFREAQERYARIRLRVYDRVEKGLGQHPVPPAPIRLADIDEHALEVRRRTWTSTHWSGHGGWDWDEIARSVRRRPSGFPVALWSGDRLLALAVGRASKRRASGARHTLSIHYIEGHPDAQHPLRRWLLPIVIEVGDEYGRVLGAERLRLIDPLPGLLPTYMRLGFGIAGRSGRRLYLERRITAAPEHRSPA